MTHILQRLRERARIDDQIIDDMAATLLDIIHKANEIDPDGETAVIAEMADEAITRWKAGMPWPRLNNPNPPSKPVLTEEGERAYRAREC